LGRSIIVRVDEALVAEARRVLGLDGVPARRVVEEAVRLALGRQLGNPRLEAIDASLSRIVQLVTGIAERLDRVEQRLDAIEQRLQQLPLQQHAEPQHARASAGGGEQQRRRGGLAGFCSEKPYDVVDLQRMRNPEGFLESARRRGLRVLWEEGATVAVLVCPGVSAAQLLEAARSDERLAEALRELGYLYEPEPGRLEWVEEPQLG